MVPQAPAQGGYATTTSSRVSLTPDGLFGFDANGNLSFVLASNTVNTWQYPGGGQETLSPGSLMIGSNLNGSANMLWDVATGRVNFRSGVTVSSFVENSGDFTAGNLLLNANGLLSKSGTSFHLLKGSQSNPSGYAKFVDDAVSDMLILEWIQTGGGGTVNRVYLTSSKIGFSIASVDVGGFTTAGLTVVGGFGCNGQAPQAAYASGGALAAYGAGTNGFDTGPHASALYAMVVAIRAALVANGIMS